MNIPENFFMYINVAVGLIYLVSCIIATKNGLLLQLISVVYTFICVYVSWLISPILASNLPLIKVDEVYNYAGINLTIVINSFIYCLIVFIILKILYWFISPLFKSISNIPILGFFNRFGGFLLGLINGTIVVLLISLLLNTPMIANSEEIKQNTVFKYGDTLTNKAMELTVKYINFDAVKDKIEDFDVDATREALKLWLKEQGIINE